MNILNFAMTIKNIKLLIKMAKRGRKRTGYFYEEQEQAVIDYLGAQTQAERDKIFNTWLKPAFTKMVESIIRRYKLYLPDEEFDETFNDVMSFLTTKLNKFDATKGYKAYSYCGTICKHYLFQKLNKFKKRQDKQESYDTMREIIHESSDYTIENVGELSEENLLTNIMENIPKEIDKIINNAKEIGLTKDEKRVGLALKELFNNWEDLFDNEIGSNKFNKSSILLYLKEVTMLTTPEIRNSMKKYKSAYYDLKKVLLET